MPGTLEDEQPRARDGLSQDVRVLRRDQAVGAAGDHQGRRADPREPRQGVVARDGQQLGDGVAQRGSFRAADPLQRGAGILLVPLRARRGCGRCDRP